MIGRFVAILALLFVAQPASAFWEYGHEDVAAIAMKNVKPATRAKIRRMLAEGALLNTPECPVGTIEQASYWADCVKPLKDAAGKSRFAYAYNWHFQNVNICQPFDLTSACAKGDCVSAQIEKQVAALKNHALSKTARLEALAFLVHLVGDLHQPLHAGDRGDRGGNDVASAYGIYAPARFGLHQIWDGPLAERALSGPPDIVRLYSPATRRRDAAGTLTDWSRESWQMSRDVAYTGLLGDPCGPVPKHSTLSNAAIADAAPKFRALVVKGGLRLARLLDEALS